jgi:hypothetical protein
MLGWQKAKGPVYGYSFELHLDAPDGKKLGEALLPAGKAGEVKSASGGNQ